MNDFLLKYQRISFMIFIKIKKLGGFSGEILLSIFHSDLREGEEGELYNKTFRLIELFVKSKTPPTSNLLRISRVIF